MAPVDDVTVSRKRRVNNGRSEQKGGKQAKSDLKPKKHNPKFRLKRVGEEASLSTEAEQRVPVLLTDVQHLLLHSLFGNLNLTRSPHWYVLDKCMHLSQTTCLVVEGVSIEHWKKHFSDTSAIVSVFKDSLVEVVTPAAYGGSLVEELALVPLSESEKENLIQKYGSLNLAIEARKDLNLMMRAVFPVTEMETDTDDSTTDKYSRMLLLLSASQLIEENYPLPLKGKLKSAYSDYVMTKDEYKPVSATSPMFAVDCEMCITNAGSELTRVSVVNEQHETVYESLVKPYNSITDYLTRFSGVTKALLEDVETRLEDVQRDLRRLLPADAVLVGQSLNADLHALKMMHPYVIDTSVVFNFTGERGRKPKLKSLAKELLSLDIQQGSRGHCSAEDALAAMRLAQLKLSRSLEFGDAVHTNRQAYKENQIKKAQALVTSEECASTIFNHMLEQKKTSVVIGCDDITGDYHAHLTNAKESFSAQLKKGKVKKVKLSTVETPDEAIDALSGAHKEYNFAMAHLKLDVTGDQQAEQLARAQAWVTRVWDGLSHAALFVVLFSGDKENNGVAMARVKHV